MERFTGPMPRAGAVYAIVAAAFLLALSIAVALRKDRSEQTSINCLHWLLVSFLIVASPHYPWYFLVLVPLLVLGQSATAWILTLACPLLYDSVPGGWWPEHDIRIALFILATIGALAYDAWNLRRKPRSPTLGETA